MADYFPQQQAPSQIGGQLPFGQGGGDMFSQDLPSAYKSAYSSALAQNQANYGNILTGYRQTLADQGQAQQAIGKGYAGLYSDVMGRIQGIDASQRQAIQDSYASQSGAAQQNMISRGLGNATVSDSVQRGLLLDKSKADIALSNQMAQLQAGYAGQIGGAALNYGNQAAMQNTALQAQQLGWMNSTNAPYPNAAAYAQLLQQQGMIGQANQDRQQQASQFQQMMAAAKSAQGIGSGGFQTRNTPAPTLAPMNPGGSPGYSSMSSITPFGTGSSITGSYPSLPPGFGAMTGPGTASFAAQQGAIGARAAAMAAAQQGGYSYNPIEDSPVPMLFGGSDEYGSPYMNNGAGYNAATYSGE